MTLDPLAAALVAVRQNAETLRGPAGKQGDPGPKGDSIRGPQGTHTVGRAGTDGTPGLVWRGAWSRTRQYEAGDVVESEGSAYVATGPSKGTKPPKGAWDLLAAKGADGVTQVIGGFGGGGSGGAAPTLAQVLAAGNDTGEQTIVMPMGGIDGTTSNMKVTLDGANGETGSNVLISGGDGTGAGGSGGGTVQLTGGKSTDGLNAGGGVRLVAGESVGQGIGATLFVDGGSDVGLGGSLRSIGGNAGTDTGADGGDIVLIPGGGDGVGRDGLVFLNLPTADPLVAGALWANLGIVIVSAG